MSGAPPQSDSQAEVRQPKPDPWWVKPLLLLMAIGYLCTIVGSILHTLQIHTLKRQLIQYYEHHIHLQSATISLEQDVSQLFAVATNHADGFNQLRDELNNVQLCVAKLLVLQALTNRSNWKIEISTNRPPPLPQGAPRRSAPTRQNGPNA